LRTRPPFGATLGYDFGERLVYWETPVAGAEAFFSTLLDAAARERPEALVMNSVTEVLAGVLTLSTTCCTGLLSRAAFP